MKRFALLLTLFAPLTSLADAGVADAGLVVPDAGLVVAAADAGVAVVVGPVTAPSLENGDFVGFLRAVHQAVLAREWGSLLFFVITLLVFLSRKFLAPKIPALASPLAAVIKTFLLSFSGMLATTWGGGDKPTFADVMTAVQIGFAAAGGWSILKALVEAAAKQWDWARWLLSFLTGRLPSVTPPPPPAPSAPRTNI